MHGRVHVLLMAARQRERAGMSIVRRRSGAAELRYGPPVLQAAGATRRTPARRPESAKRHAALASAIAYRRGGRSRGRASVPGACREQRGSKMQGNVLAAPVEEAAGDLTA